MREERLRFGAPPRVLEGALWSPESGPRGGAVVCHPHPEYGGDMDVAVVRAVAERLGDHGVAALRFNFGGVGHSTGHYDGGGAERGDVAAAVAALDARLPAGAPLAVVGYSFGSWVGAMAAAELPRVDRVVAVAPPLAFYDWQVLGRLRLPLAVVVGDRDQFCPADRLESLGELAVTTVLEGADHFLGGFEGRVAAAVCAHLGAE